MVNHEIICDVSLVMLHRYNGWDGSQLAKVASDIATTVLGSCETLRCGIVRFLTRFTANFVSAAVAPQQLIQPSSNSQKPSSLPPPSPAPPFASQPLQRSSSSGKVTAVSVSVDCDDAAASAELLAMLSSAGLVPASCRQRMMLALLSMGISSEKSLQAAILRDSAFLEQVNLVDASHLSSSNSLFSPRLRWFLLSPNAFSTTSSANKQLLRALSLLRHLKRSLCPPLPLTGGQCGALPLTPC
jgi:hypothetical protein